MTETAAAAPAAAGESEIPDDLRCAGCDYALRGLDPTGRCPECNHPIAESIAADARLPKGESLRAMKRGSIALAVAVLLLDLPYLLIFVIFSRSQLRLGSFIVDPDGLQRLGEAALLLPAAWWLSRADLAAPRWRRWLILRLPLVLAAFAAMAIARFGEGIMQPVHMLAPYVIAIEFILLLGVVARQSRRIPRVPSFFSPRGAQILFGGVLLLHALLWTPIFMQRIYESQFAAVRQRSPLPSVVEALLYTIGPVLSLVRPLVQLLTVTTLVVFTVVLSRRTRFARHDARE